MAGMGREYNWNAARPASFVRLSVGGFSATSAFVVVDLLRNDDDDDEVRAVSPPVEGKKPFQ
jgi:hypothetical protein